ncbi:hypothetical protein FRB98_000926 [Tulasnella sp. 332]|nr:hypothetical protein FRB98_000926 [Tulasnella sp. 332]
MQKPRNYLQGQQQQMVALYVASITPPPPVSRRAVTMSPTFHIDPERSSSSENGSFSHLFYQFPSQRSPASLPPRDSMTTSARTATHNSSSVYPARSISTNSYSANSPPSPSSPSSSSFSASIHTSNTGDTDDARNNGLRFALDPDDVSGRLRLLVKNNYYLPPAHSKPSHHDLQSLAIAADAINPPTKTSPSFRDIFRVGKPAKSPPPVVPPPAPRVAPHSHQPLPARLRKAKSQGNIDPRAHTRKDTALSMSTTSQGSSLKLSAGGPQERKGRVVVIREKMDDLFVAAKEAEVQMLAIQRQERTGRRSEDDEDQRGRGSGADQGQKTSKKRAARSTSRRSRNTTGTDEEFIVDPTDAVDLPSYSFQPQASAVVGLGLRVDASGLSAGALADQLAPSMTMTMTKEDMLWRKALLHQAVGMSMMSIPPPSTPSSLSHPERLIRSAKHSNNPSPSSFFASSPGGGVGSPGPGSPSPLPASTTNTSSALGKNRSLVQPIVEDLPRAVSALKKRTESGGGGKKGLHLTVDIEGGRDPNTNNAGTRPHPLTQSSSPRSPFADGQSRAGGPPSPALRSATPIRPTEPLKPPPARTRRLESADSASNAVDSQQPPTQNSGDWKISVEEKEQPPRRSDEQTKMTRSGDDGVATAGQGRRRLFIRRSKEEERERAQNRMATTFPLNEGETIRKTLSKPLLSETVDVGEEGSQGHQSLGSSEYFTPRSESRRSEDRKTSAEEKRREPEVPAAETGRPRSGSNTTSGSEYSEDDGDQQVVQQRGSTEDQRRRSEEPASPGEAKSLSSYIQMLTPKSDVFPESYSSANRPSFALSEFSRGETPRTESRHYHSNDSYSRAGSRAQRASSMEESRVSMHSMAFGSRGSQRQKSYPDPAVTPGIGLPALPSTGSGIGLHSLDGVGGVGVESQETRHTASTKRAMPQRQDSEPLTLGYGRVPAGSGPSVISHQPDKAAPPQLHLDLSGVSALHDGGLRSAPAPAIDHSAPFPNSAHGSFLDLEISGWKSSDEEKEKEPVRHRLESLSTPSDPDTGSRSRVSSYTGTIVPNPEKGVYAAPTSYHQKNESVSFISMDQRRDPVNPYLAAIGNPHADTVPAKTASGKAASVSTSSPGSSFFSAFSSLKLGGRDSAGTGGTFGSSSAGKMWKKRPAKAGIASDSSGSLLRYANNPKARSTPTLATPTSFEFGRRSNVSDQLDRHGRRGGSRDGGQDWQMRDSETRKLDGMLLEHMKAEKDLIKLVAARGLGSGSNAPAAGSGPR